MQRQPTIIFIFAQTGRGATHLQIIKTRHPSGHDNLEQHVTKTPFSGAQLSESRF